MFINLNTKRHKILKILSDSFIKFESGQNDIDDKFGVSFVLLMQKLNCNREQLEEVIGLLYLNEEVKYTDINFEGLTLTLKGFTSFSDKKYIVLNEKNIINSLKNFVQIVIPVLSLVIAFLALTFKLDKLNTKTNNEIKKINEKLVEQNNRLKIIEKSNENNKN